MIIDISKIILTKNKKESFDCSIDSSNIDYNHNSFPIINNKPFELIVVNVEAKHLEISCNTGLTAVIPCDRCLEDVNCSFDISINKSLKISEGAIVCEDDENSFINEYELDVDRLLFDEILVDWPSKVLCKDDCLGICSKCGANLNTSPCDCDRRVIDPRMAAFQDVFKEFKEV